MLRSGHQGLKDGAGGLTLEKLIQSSQDHENGPGMNLICRHDGRFEMKTSLSAAVMEINRGDPASSSIRIALGKPCHARTESQGNISITMKARLEDIPAGFVGGSVWKRSHSDAPLQAETDSARPILNAGIEVRDQTLNILQNSRLPIWPQPT